METKRFITKKRAYIIVGVGICFGVCVIATDPKKTTGAPVAETQAKGVANAKYMVKSTDEVKRRFNAFSDEVHFNYHLQDIEIKEGTLQNSFENHLSKILTFGADLNKDNSVKDVYAICSGDGTTTSGENAIALMVSVVAVADPSLTPVQRIGILKSMGMLNSNVKHLDTTYSSNGISYEANSTSEWANFSARPL